MFYVVNCDVGHYTADGQHLNQQILFHSISLCKLAGVHVTITSATAQEANSKPSLVCYRRLFLWASF